MVMAAKTKETRNKLKQKAMTEKKTVKYGDEPAMKRVSPNKEPKNKMKG